jgi:hypothetical protein
MHIHDTLQCATKNPAGLSALPWVWLCYAKITPAALHCGEFARHCLANAEAAGVVPEFGLSD